MFFPYCKFHPQYCVWYVLVSTCFYSTCFRKFVTSHTFVKQQIGNVRRLQASIIVYACKIFIRSRQRYFVPLAFLNFVMIKSRFHLCHRQVKNCWSLRVDTLNQTSQIQNSQKTFSQIAASYTRHKPYLDFWNYQLPFFLDDTSWSGLCSPKIVHPTFTVPKRA